MSIRIEDLAGELEPQKTVIFFGAGSSIPSGAPTVDDLRLAFSKACGIAVEDYSLSEIASLAESRIGRKKLISTLRSKIVQLKPTGGLRNLAHYGWKSIFTTNYDELIENIYQKSEKKLRVYHSNFSFTEGDQSEDCSLFKLHGTIDKDISDGVNSRIIISELDYEHTHEYREALYDRFKNDINNSDLLIIGYSLSDAHIKEIINRALVINAKSSLPSKIYLLMYHADEQRASLFEKKGIKVAFGGVDDFFATISQKFSRLELFEDRDLTSLDVVPVLTPTTIDVSHEAGKKPDVSGMFNGWPANYPEIAAGYTFHRSVADDVVEYFLGSDGGNGSLCVTLLGASGVGKTTAARQIIAKMRKDGALCWEHKDDHTLNADAWFELASHLKKEQILAVLLVDNAHEHLYRLNDLLDKLAKADNAYLKVIACSSKNQWYPRVKTPVFYRFGKSFYISKLSEGEIDRLLQLLDQNRDVSALVENQFSGFNREERRRRLSARCEADMFVCLKNIFANESFDNIVLREFAELSPQLQDIYRHVAALETSGVRVHRQFIIRLLNVDGGYISGVLENLTDIINEYSVNEGLGIYGWKCRHSVIAEIITKYKYKEPSKIIDLFDNVIDNISPSYDIEVRSMRELCNVDNGIGSIPDKDIQNRLIRKIMSVVPGERVPRHRLIRNLIDQGYFDKADTEIRLFDSDFGPDGPVHRYKIKILVERAARSKGLLTEDRVAILQQAHELAVRGATKYPFNKNILYTFAELGIEYCRLTGSYDYFDEAINKLEVAEEKLGDPQISAMISRYNRRILGQVVEGDDVDIEIDESSLQ